ncbi:unnamed protein product [Brassicogethes aeneus]|uniref:MD-2-related lipid-recognition domain-containing protein n=1 Tax=Brassicogethes aeneus TaxID=1431903 RepID=A0A9P0FMB4_BRAAE|nr:unnamed protein product [Brassicogethes aeneus]
MIFKNSLILLLCLFGAVYGKFIQCEEEEGKSRIGEVIDVEVSGCQNTKYCPLIRGRNATITITFKANEDSDELKSVVHGEVLSVLVPFSLPNGNGCSESGVTCPVKSGQTYKYSTSLPVLSEYPKMKLRVKWQLQNKESSDFVCVFIFAQIKDA